MAPRVLVAYAYHETPAARANLRFFLTHGVEPLVDGGRHAVVLVVNSDAFTVVVPPRAATITRVLRKANTGYDFGSWAAALASVKLDDYDRFVFLNDTVRGPFLASYAHPAAWTDVFTERITDRVKLVGVSINCVPVDGAMAPFAKTAAAQQPTRHVQSMVMATDRVGVDIGIASRALSDHAAGRLDAIVNHELGYSGAVLARGYDIDCLLPGVAHAPPRALRNPMYSYDGAFVHPIEAVFVKSDLGAGLPIGVTPPGVTSLDLYDRALANHTRWRDDAAYGAFDWQWYYRRYADLARNGLPQRAADVLAHWMDHGRYEARSPNAAYDARQGGALPPSYVVSPAALIASQPRIAAPGGDVVARNATQRILYVQPLFAPTDGQYARMKRSIRSMGAQLRAGPHVALRAAFGGWVSSERRWRKLTSLIRRELGDARLCTSELGGCVALRYDANVGKAHIVNDLVRRVGAAPYDRLLLADSDIVFTPDAVPRLWHRLEMAALHATVARANKPFGIVALDQREASCHLYPLMPSERRYKCGAHQERMVWSDTAAGVAGGCLYVAMAAWRAVGGYGVTGPYVGDDADLRARITGAGYAFVLSTTIAVVHPPDLDAEYAAWKVRQVNGAAGTLDAHGSVAYWAQRDGGGVDDHAYDAARLDWRWYAAANGVRDDRAMALAHATAHPDGPRNGDLDWRWYVATYSDVRLAAQATAVPPAVFAACHWNNHGAAERRAPNASIQAARIA